MPHLRAIFVSFLVSQAAVLFANAGAILNNERFLEPRGLGFSQLGGANALGEGPGTLKNQVIGFVHATQYLRLPLIIVNLILIFVKVLFG